MRTRTLPLIVLLILVLHETHAGSETFFPALGPGAEYQRTIDLLHPAVLLCVAPHPGDEDFFLMSHARLALGARVVVVYVTNGEALQSDETGGIPPLTAGERKEEALAVCARLGAAAYFLNFPDQGIVRNTRDLSTIWVHDSLMARMAVALRSYRPDALVLLKDCRDGSSLTPADSLLRSWIPAAAAAAADPGIRTLFPPWTVERVMAAQVGVKTSSRALKAVHPIWRRSYGSLATEAAALYRSLRFELPSLNPVVARSYASLTGSRKTGRTFAAEALLNGLPATSPALAGVHAAVRRVSALKHGASLEERLRTVSAAIDSTQQSQVRGPTRLSGVDRRVLQTVGGVLEDLRCTLLQVEVDVMPSDTMVTELQVFFVEVKSVRWRFSGPLRIVFPLSQGMDWKVSGASSSDLELTPGQKFEIITPETLEKNSPPSSEGVYARTMRTHFPYVIYHRDSVRARNFAYRGDILLRVGPRRSFEIRTPIVLARDGAPVITVFQNYSRDPFKGRIQITDSLLTGSVNGPLYIPSKDSVVTDTLRLPLGTLPPPGDRILEVEVLKKGGSRPFVLRSAPVAKDTVSRIALVSSIKNSQAAQALGILGLSWDALEPGKVADIEWRSYRTVILDRDALADTMLSERLRAPLERWVQEGGRLVVLPQFSGAVNDSLLPARFRRSSGFPSGTPLQIDTTDALFERPNHLSSQDWEGWVIARSWGYLVGTQMRAATVLVRAEGRPLAARWSFGRGSIICLALDLESQLVNVHPGTLRLLANLTAAPGTKE